MDHLVVEDFEEYTTPKQLLQAVVDPDRKKRDRRSDWVEVLGSDSVTQVRVQLDPDKKGIAAIKYFQFALGIGWGCESFLLFRSEEQPRNFPKLTLPKKQWVAARFGGPEDTFANALYVGGFTDALMVIVNGNGSKMEAGYKEILGKLSVAQLAAMRESVQEQMLQEIEDANRAHEQTLSTIRSKYRSDIQLFASVADTVQDAQDAKDKAVYVFELYGYPPSKQYKSFKQARRAHSKRNAPHTACVMYRVVQGSTHKTSAKKFAQWSIADRVWNLI